MTDKQIMACNLPGDLFSSPEKMESEFVELAKTWHPDKLGGNSLVMAHINTLHQHGRRLVAADEWVSSRKKIVKLLDGRTVKISFLKESEFEMGVWYICKSVCAFVFKNNYARVFKMPKFKFANDRMKEEFSRYLPNVVQQCGVVGGEKIIVIDRSPDLVLLRDILSHYGGSVPPRHVAWILSSLYNLCCFFKYNGIVHHSIGVDTYFISPKLHGGALLGGWWYYASEGGKVRSVPATTHSLMTKESKSSKKASFVTDLECVKFIGRTLLGSPSGSSLYTNPDIPKPMIQFLRTISSEDAVKEYSAWTKVLHDCFGKKKFIEMDVDAGSIYNPS